MEKIYILHVDDEPVILKATKDYLEINYGFEVDSIGSATDALEILRNKKFDAIVSDYEMPGLNGIEFLKQVRSIDNEIPFIIFTGRGREDVVIDALNEGADLYLQKGGNAKAQFLELVNSIKKLVERKKARDSQMMSEKTARALLDASHSAATLLDREGRIIDANEAYPRIFGLSRDDVIGKSVWDFYPSEVARKRKKILREVFRTGIPYRSRNVEWEGFWDYVVYPITDDKGEVRNVAVYAMDITRKIETEELYHTIFENTGTAMMIVKDDMIVSHANGEMEKLTGYSKEEMENKVKLPDLVSSEYAEKIKKYHRLRRANPKKVPKSYEFNLITKKGEVKKVKIIATMIPGTKQSVITVNDITEQKKAEERVREEKEKYTQLFNAANDMIYLHEINPDGSPGRILETNEQACLNMGYGHDEFRQMTVAELNDPEYPGDMSIIIGALKEKETDLFEWRHVTKDGRKIPVEVSVHAFEMGGRNVALAIVRDITERKSLEKELLLTLDATTEGIWKWNFKTDVLYFSPRYYTMLGYKPFEFPATYESWVDLIHPDDLDGAIKTAESYLETKPDTYENEFRLRTKDGNYRWMHAYARVVERDENGNAIRIIGNHQDITEIKKKEEELVRQKKFYQKTLESIQDGLWVTDRNDRIIYANKSMCNIAKIDRSELLGKSVISDFSEDTSGDVIKYYREAREEQKPVEYRAFVVTPGGQETWQTGWLVPLLEDGAFGGMIATIRDVTAYVEREEELKITRFSVEKSPESIFWVNPDGTFFYVNDAALRELGYSRDELLDLGVNDVDPEYPIERRDEFWEELKQQKSSRIETTHRRKDGSILAVEVISYYLRYGDREYEIANARDITAEKEAWRKYRDLFNSVNDAVIYSPVGEDGMPGKYIEVNDAAVEMLGYSRDELLTKSPADLSPPELIEKIPGIVKTLKEKKHLTFEWEYIRKDGTRLPVEVSVKHAMLGDQDVFLSVIRDITERKERQGALEESERKYRNIVNNVNDAIIICSVNPDGSPGKFIDANTVASRFFGYSREELLEITPEDLSRPQDWEHAFDALGPLIEKKHHVFEWVNVRKDGTYIPVELSSHYLEIEGQKVYLNVVRDISGRIRAEKALRDANEKLNILSSITRHDILNQIMAIDTYLELMKMKTDDTDKVVENIDKCREIMKTIEKDITFTRDYQNLGINGPEWQDLRRIIDEMGKRIIDRIEIIKSLKGVQIYADPMLEKVFSNLFHNSVLHGEHVTRISVEFSEKDGEGIIVVEDDGIGIPEDEKKKIFERGFGKNHGFGLFLSREILELTDITIEENGVPGKGARFEICVPAEMWKIPGNGD